MSIYKGTSMIAGGAPVDVYTKTNLLGGNDIEIIPEPVEGGIDEYTLSCFHLDETDNVAVDEVTGYSFSTTSDTTLHKFGTGCATFGLDTAFPWSVNVYESFSFDYWLYRRSDRGFALGFNRPGYSNSFTVVLFSGNYPINLEINGTKYDTGVYIDNNAWSHIYAYYNAKDQSFHLFVNGKEIYSIVSTHTFSGLNSFTNDGYTTSRVDEVRISKCIRWTEDFEPPTQPYSKAEPTGNMVINFVGDTQTVKNDLDELGDQVSEIESKIPGTTSTTNLLVNKSELESITNTKVTGEGVTSIKVLTQADYTALETKDQNTCYIIVG